jgi:MFS transporter, CP family, cyanate transporter
MSAPNGMKMISEPHTHPYRWVMLTLLWLIYFSFGLVARSPSPLVTPIIKDLNVTFGQMGFILGSWQMTYILVAVMAGVILDRWGIRKSIFVGVLIIGLSASLRAVSTGFATLFIFVAVFGLGGPMVSIGCPKAIALWFKGKERGMAVGIYTTGPWIGGMVSLATTNSVIMPLVGNSWRFAFVFCGMIAFGFAMLWWFMAKEAEESFISDRSGAVEVLVALIKIHNVRIILISGLLSFAVMHGFSAWLPKILERSGMSSVWAGYAAAVPYLTSIPAVLIFPQMIPQRIRGRMIALFAVSAGSAILLISATDLPVFLGLLIFGATGPSVFPLLVLELMETPAVGTRYLGSATGVFFCVAEIGGFFGPFTVGFLVDLTQSFLAGTGFLAMLGGIIFILMFLLKPHSGAYTPDSHVPKK